MARVDLSALDLMRLSGDEDCGVGLDCMLCDRGGLPLAYYQGISSPYAGNVRVAEVGTIEALVIAALVHAREVHGASGAEGL